jgi:hypothetical protein
MFLTTFDKKMYEEAIREDGLAELAKKADEEKARGERMKIGLA